MGGVNLKQDSEALYGKVNRCNDDYRNRLCGQETIELWPSGRRQYAAGSMNLPKI